MKLNLHITTFALALSVSAMSAVTADASTTRWQQTYEDSSTTGWTIGTGASAAITAASDGSHYYYINQGGGSGNRTANLNLTTASSYFASASEYTLEWDYAVAFANQKTSTTTIVSDQGTVAYIETPAWSYTSNVYNASGTLLGSFTNEGYYNSAASVSTNKVHITVYGLSTGVKLKVTQGTTTIVNKKTVLSTAAHLTAINNTLGRAVCRMYFDNFKLIETASVSTPVISQSGSTVTITGTSGYTIQYSLNGGSTQTYSSAITLSANAVVRAWLVQNGSVVSSVASQFCCISGTATDYLDYYYNVKESYRGLWAFYKSGVFCSWRMRATDPSGTQYKVFVDGKLFGTYTGKTNFWSSKLTKSNVFSVVVLNASGTAIEKQTGVSVDDAFYHYIALDRPADDGSITYTPNDCSAYDMDGDGEEEIILKWNPSNATPYLTATSPAYIDCYKLDGTKLWRINLGPNVVAGLRITFLCYDFDGDGYGEMITKTAQGTCDSSGSYLSKGSAAGVDHTASSVNSAGVITDGGYEWITCFNGVTGKELATIDYYPTFNVKSNWNPSGSDTNTYGHRGCWFKGGVAFLPVNGVTKPCAVTTRGIYTYSYAAAYSWDGSTLTRVWKHASETDGKGIYGEGHHSIAIGDCDGDGYDEIVVGSACLDHDGSTLWRTGFGHGDVLRLGEFNPYNDGLEVFLTCEETTSPYDCVLLSAKTGTILASQAQTGSDTGRGLIGDFDSNYAGAEFASSSNANFFSCTGTSICAWQSGSVSSSTLNNRIYWDGDLYDEYMDRGHIDKWNSSTQSFSRLVTNYSQGYGANLNNSTKNNPCLQADLVGDWREEVVFWCSNGDNYYLTMHSTYTTSDYAIPYLRDDHTYDMAVAWQNTGYNQVPHLGYSPLEYINGTSNARVMDESTISEIGDEEEETEENADQFDVMGRKTDNNKGLRISNGKIKVTRD